MGLLKGLSKLQIVLAKTDEHIHEVLEVRRKVYCNEISWLPPERLTDKYDERAKYFMAKRRSKPVAAARLILGDEELEVEEYLNIDLFRQLGKCAEISRLSVLPNFRCSLVTVGLFRAFYRFAITHNIRWFFIGSTPMGLKMYRKLGFEPIGNPVVSKTLNINQRFLVLDLEKARKEWEINRPAMLKYFDEPLDGIG